MKKVLVVIDMQNDFIDGSLGTAEAQAIVGKVLEKIKAYPADQIYATRDTHGENYLETPEGKSLPVVHCARAPTAGRSVRKLPGPCRMQSLWISPPSVPRRWQSFFLRKIKRNAGN